MKTNLLIFNSIIDPVAVKEFDIAIRKIFQPFPISFTIRYLHDTAPPFLLQNFTHLLLSGSEMRASQHNNSDDIFYALINHFVAADKAVLGICYGHQIIARALTGNSVCKPADSPEFGWRKVRCSTNPLFTGIHQYVFFESHYDEVYDLPADFEIIAATSEVAVQGYQYSGRRIWGVQFHPEVDIAKGKKMLARTFTRDQAAAMHFRNELPAGHDITQNYRIFSNFIKM
ncbi:MAG: gamma-glutamyl-gamma-aminobutyrate hydrolase family protein [Candidatus Cloacimonetes bacterium]|nr:gamma-glutamyl-gamma-aminobutyrate hydrolase family protein [Candidatus Cloacimonadota bacterium]